MRVCLVSLYFHPATAYGGPVASTWSLARALAAEGARVRVLTTDADGEHRLPDGAGWRELAPGVEARYCRRLGRGLLAPAMASEAVREIAAADQVYVSGLMVWLLPWISVLAWATRTPLTVAPRGMALPEAMASKVGKKGLFLLASRLAGAGRARFHATSEAEAASLRALFPRGRVAVISNGVEIPTDAELATIPPRASDEPPYLLYLGRLHPHKQPEAIVEAFAHWARTPNGRDSPLHLRLVGPGDEAIGRRLREQAARTGVGERVEIEPPVAGAAKSRLLANAEALLLASKSENFGMSVAEALAHATPCLVTETAPWSGLEEHRCGFWVESTTEALAAAIGRLERLSPAERTALGTNGRAWMQRDFAWPALARRMLEWWSSGG